MDESRKVTVTLPQTDDRSCTRPVINYGWMTVFELIEKLFEEDPSVPWLELKSRSFNDEAQIDILVRLCRMRD